MQQQHSVSYTIWFSAAVCGVCAIFVATSAVSLADLQNANVELSRKRNVLEAAGVVKNDEKIAAAEIENRFASFKAVLVNLKTHEEATEEELKARGIDIAAYDQQKAKKSKDLGGPAPENRAGISKFPEFAMVYKELDAAGNVKTFVLPIEGYGLWSTLYGFVAIDSDTTTVKGLAYYDQKETAGLGGEVDNPRWKALWPGRKIYDSKWEPKIEVIKGGAGPASQAPYSVDGLSGATITSRAVTNMLHLWMGDDAFGPYLEKFRKGAA